MWETKGWLVREPMNEDEVRTLTDQARMMYNELEERRKADGDLMRKAYSKGGAAVGKKSFAFQTHYEELRRKNDQLVHMWRQGVSPTDKRILAEAAHVLIGYRKRHGKRSRMFLASTDASTFVPYAGECGTSRPITDEIEKRFGVECEWPKEVLQEAKQILGRKLLAQYSVK
jgi:hypothetical protein